ncbi:M28 family peptidase [Sulfidibacter corallicola]|uniref:M28 family peptidase n=1 Tax=Sulfidibacter corallicola TaxID=2818388 RepID=A0A8A4TX06_SULCO|nr:M28 family peptidase [Sulfidibacter corallicola]QTD54010.1 M28 family peptidase [Sulfidibacter corallicola]
MTIGTLSRTSLVLQLLLGWLCFCCPLFGTESTVSSAETLKQWAFTLAGDEMQGRQEGTEGAKRASEWLAARFKELGLKPAPGQTDFFQPFSYEIQDKKVRARNVIGYLEGSDPKRRDEFIVLSAHYDHVGVNPELTDDPIFNGADDDASGTVLVMAVAKALSESAPDKRPARSVIFVAWAAEEVGLKGSRHYAKNPLFPLEKTVVNLNFEMVGHATKTGRRNFWMTGKAYSDLADIVVQQAKQRDWTLVENPFPQQKLFFRSDNISLVMLEHNREKRTARGIPAHSFTTWGGEDHYHRPHDEPQFLDYQNMAELAQLMTAVTLDVANREPWVAWKPNDQFVFERFTK